MSLTLENIADAVDLLLIDTSATQHINRNVNLTKEQILEIRESSIRELYRLAKKFQVFQ